MPTVVNPVPNPEPNHAELVDRLFQRIAWTLLFVAIVSVLDGIEPLVGEQLRWLSHLQIGFKILGSLAVAGAVVTLIQKARTQNSTGGIMENSFALATWSKACTAAWIFLIIALSLNNSASKLLSQFADQLSRAEAIDISFAVLQGVAFAITAATFLWLTRNSREDSE